MTDILQRIMDERRADVADARGRVPVEALRERAAGRVHRSLVERLGRGAGTRVIAEMKKASPSAGVLREDYRPAEIATAYAAAGAAGLSVLTEPRHFLGSGDHLCAVRAVTDLPILRKDFICDPYQVHEAAAWGADVVLLIAAVLDDGLMRGLYDAAVGLGLEVLAEAHTREELERAAALEGAILGVNSRDLKTLKTDLATAQSLAEHLPAGRPTIAESGIRTRADIERLKSAGYGGFLVGESLLGAPEPGKRLAELLG